MFLSGFTDEAADDIEGQIEALNTLGWNHIEPRNIGGTNLTLIDEKEFEKVCALLDGGAITVNCFGSGIANWAKKITDPPDSSYDELKAAIPRMHRLQTRFIRVMSFVYPPGVSIDDGSVKKEVFKRMERLTKMAEDGGVILLHENCDGWGGFSWEHTLRLVDAMDSESFRLIYDTGNPVCHRDFRGKEPYAFQNGLEFYNRVKDFVSHIHIKDGVMREGAMQYRFPGEGDGFLREICTDLKSRGYDAGFSIEPHMGAVAHDPDAKKSGKGERFDMFVEYGRRANKILKNVGYKL